MNEPGPQPRRFATTKVEVEGRERTTIVELPSLALAPWDAAADLTVVGRSTPRVDALEKVSGHARFTVDLRRPGMLHAAILRAPVASGRVVRLDAAPAMALPGVRGTLTLRDVSGITVDGVQLFDQVIHYAGQPLLALCADSDDLARRALRAILLEVEPAEHAVTASQALADGAPRVHAAGNTSRNSPRVYTRGDVEAGLRGADVAITREYRTPVALHTALEPHGAVAEWSGDHVTVWESTQGIFNTRADLAAALRVPLSRIRVITDYMGGGFGAKNGASHATYIAALLASRLQRPVRCVLDREAEQTDAGNRPATIQRVTIGAMRDGTLVAIDLDATIALGIGGWQAGPARIYRELYRCPNVRTAETFVFTNMGAMASFRAPGHVEGAFGLESAMDAVARTLDLDPLEVRRRNYAERDQDKDRPYSAKNLDRCYAEGSERFGWHEKRTAKRVTGGRVRRGIGMASLTWGAGGGPPAYASVRLNADGSADVLTGTQDLGTGSRTVLAQIAAEQLGARIQEVRTILGDTERLPYAPNSWGSITTASVGPAVRVAAEEARRLLLDAAANFLDATPGDLSTRDGVVHLNGSDRTLTFREVCERLGNVMIMGHGSRGPNPDRVAMSAFGAQFAEVEVDIETGRVRVLQVVAAHDSGRIINPTLAESQLEGGIIQGLGYALFEERVVDERRGLALNPTMHDYKIPTIADVPKIDAFFVGGPDAAANHTGAKGLAEPPIIGIAAAVANAVTDALGVEVSQIPLTPWRLCALLHGSA